MLHGLSHNQLPRRHLTAFSVLWIMAAFCSGPPCAKAEGPICVQNPDSATQVFEPNPTSPGVLMETLCSQLTEPSVRVSVLSHFQETVASGDTWDETFHFGYVCEGSVTVARNHSRYLPRGSSDVWSLEYSSDEEPSVHLAEGDSCFFFSCYKYSVYSIQNGRVHRIVHLTTLNDTSCIIDLNQCASGSARCDHDCVDIRDGSHDSYFCTCRKGFALGQDLHSCYDVDECELGEDNCDQICRVDGDSGWFNCSCRDGFFLSQDGHTCTDIDECEMMNGTTLCETNTTGRQCNNTPGSYQCLCLKGFQFSVQQNMCTDINECTDGSSLCQHGCDNIEGGYNCSCRTVWYVPDGLYNCTAMDVCSELAVSCGRHSNCVNSPDSEEGYRCVCGSGYRQDGESCSLIGIVHVYWVGSVVVLVICLVLIGFCLLLRHKYLQNKHDIQKRYGVLFRYNMKKEKVDPSYVPIDFAPMRPISYTFSLMSTLELYGYSSHHSLTELTPEGKLFSQQNVHYITPPGDEDKTRRELSAIVEDREDIMSDENLPDTFPPDLDEESIEREDFEMSASCDYVKEAQSTPPYQYPTEFLRCEATNVLAYTTEEKHEVASDGYVEERVLHTSNLKAENHTSFEAGDYIDETNMPGLAEPGEQSEVQLTKNGPNPDYISTTEVTGEELDSHSPNESSVADTAFGVHAPPAPLHQFTETRTDTNTTSSSEGYASETERIVSKTASYITDSEMTPDSASKGYTSEYISVDKVAPLPSQPYCNTDQELQYISICGANSDYLSDGDQYGSVSHDSGLVSEPTELPLSRSPPPFTADHLQEHRSQQYLHSHIETSHDDPYINSELTEEDSSSCADNAISLDTVQSATDTGTSTNESPTDSGYISYPVDGKTTAPSTTVCHSHSGYVPSTEITNDKSCIPLSKKSQNTTQYVTNPTTMTDVAKDHSNNPIETRCLDYEPCVEKMRLTMREDGVVSSSGYIETSQLHFIQQHNHSTRRN